MRTLAPTAFALACVLAAPARAALTDSEKAQVQGFVRSGDPKSAGKVRALVARPDLGPEEAAEPLIQGYRRARFDEQRERFTRLLLHGPGSEASRSALVVPLVQALLARASEVMAELPTARAAWYSEKAQRAADELVRIHRFVADHVANAGRPPPDGHDPSAGIRDDVLEAAARAYGKHLEQQHEWLQQGTIVEGALVRIRAQAGLVTADLARGVVGRHEVARWLGLSGARAGLFQRRGVLLEDGGSGSEDRVAAAVRMLESAAAAPDGVSVWLIDKSPPGDLRTRGEVARAGVTLGAAPVLADTDALFGSEVSPVRIDRAMQELAHSIAWLAARHALARDPELRRRAATLSERVAQAGPPGMLGGSLGPPLLALEGASVALPAASPELIVEHALQQVLLDLPRAVDLAAIAAHQNRLQPAGQLVLALSALAAGRDEAGELTAGRAGADGGVEPLPVAKLEREGGVVRGFQLGSDTWRFELDASGLPARVLQNGAAPVTARLAHVRLRTDASGRWQTGGVEFTRLFGEPEAAALDDGRLIVASAKRGSFDALGAGGETAELELSASIEPIGAGGGLLALARPGESSYAGVALLVEGMPRRALLVLVDGRGKAVELAPPTELAGPRAGAYRLRLAVSGVDVTAEIDGKKLRAKLAAPLEPGRAGLTVRQDGRIGVREFRASTLGAPKPKGGKP
jgi:hypothetical protein